MKSISCYLSGLRAYLSVSCTQHDVLSFLSEEQILRKYIRKKKKTNRNKFRIAFMYFMENITRKIFLYNLYLKYALMSIYVCLCLICSWKRNSSKMRYKYMKPNLISLFNFDCGVHKTTTVNVLTSFPLVTFVKLVTFVCMHV